MLTTVTPRNVADALSPDFPLGNSRRPTTPGSGARPRAESRSRGLKRLRKAFEQAAESKGVDREELERRFLRSGHTDAKFTMRVYQQVLDVGSDTGRQLTQLLGASAEDAAIQLSGRALWARWPEKRFRGNAARPPRKRKTRSEAGFAQAADGTRTHDLLSDMSTRERNIAWWRFTRRETRVVRDDAETAVVEGEIVADLHDALGRYPADEALAELIDDLRASSPRFAELWEQRPVARRIASRKTFDHPEVGPITLDCDVLVVHRAICA
jgi:hypothetical protein